MWDRTHPEPVSFSDRVSVFSSDVLLTLSLDWLDFIPASAPAASFLFFLANNFLKVWNLDFFFPKKKDKKKIVSWLNICTSDINLEERWWIITAAQGNENSTLLHTALSWTPSVVSPVLVVLYRGNPHTHKNTPACKCLSVGAPPLTRQWKVNKSFETP